jgi:hypothetical protein
MAIAREGALGSGAAGGVRSGRLGASMILAMTLLLAQSSGPVWRDRATNCDREPWENDPAGILEINTIRQPNSNWRRTASELLVREDFHGKIFVAALLARHGDYSGWPQAREEFLFRIAVWRDSQVMSSLAAFWNMTTALDPKPGAALREIQEMAWELKKKDREGVLRRIAAFDPEGWVRKP